ncbi:MAG TPA: hypothetical protein DCM28_23090 [Phycisphaerales bacterium]|nr:hypothetical protein [Phycisphaerales bacterium]HCD32914.1 hypothetical protein [Phycisphaerales bacterium]|tara:strand:+ start:1092 stop:1655 length:564 start_codon:yes stop_codon:yes gene_type:complete
MRRSICGILVLALMTLAGCESLPVAQKPQQADMSVNHGYALLYDTVSQVSQVDKILYLKKADKPVSELLEEIAQLTKQAKTKLDTFVKEDAALGYDKDGLPVAEVASREAISSATTKTILFSSGKTFEFNILLSQHQALNYIIYMSQTLAKQDSNDSRKTYLKQLSKDAEPLNQRVLALLREAYVNS